jgi:hypothetical protein
MRWSNVLKKRVAKNGGSGDDINGGVHNSNFTVEEDDKIISAQSLLGNKWAQIALRLPGVLSRPCI